MIKLRIAIPSLLVIACFSSTCEKADSAEPEQKSEIVYGHGNPKEGECLIRNFGSTFFYYDDKNRIAQIIYANSDQTNIYYNSDNTISKTEQYVDGEMAYYSLFEWSGTVLTEKGFVANKKKSFENPKFVKEFDNEYRIQRINIYTADGFEKFYDFVWENENIIRKERWEITINKNELLSNLSNKNQDFQLAGITVFTYDSVLNPTQTIHKSGYLSSFNVYEASLNSIKSIENFDKNNVLLEKTIYEYRFKEKNLPIWQKISWEGYGFPDGNIRTSVDSLTIEYNCK